MMLAANCLMLAALPLGLFIAQPQPPPPPHLEPISGAQLIDNDTRLGYEFMAGGCAVFCGVDYRIELSEYLENLNGGEDASNLNPAQVHPLRAELLKYMEPYQDDPISGRWAAFCAQYDYALSLEKACVCFDSFDAIDPQYEWYALLSPAGREHVPDAVQFNRDTTEIMSQLHKFSEDTHFADWCQAHHAQYAAIVSELMVTTDNLALLSDLLGQFPVPASKVCVIGTPLVNPGRNYMTVPSAEPDKPIVHHFGPYKLVDQSIFSATGWQDCPISFNDRKQFIELAVHELSHTITVNEVQRVLRDRQAEVGALMEPVSFLAEQGYGELPDNALKYLDELIVRARTVECVRRYVGESAFRQALAVEIPRTHGYAAYLWRYFYLDHDAFADAGEFDRLLALLPDEMARWPEQGLAKFGSRNEYSMTLNGWFADFIPAFYEGNEVSFGLVISDNIDTRLADSFTELLQTKLGVPKSMEHTGADDPRPFKLALAVCSQDELIQRAAAAGLDAGQTTACLAALSGPHAVALISKASQPSAGVTVTWDVLAGTTNLDRVVPYYFPEATAMLVVDQQVVLQDDSAAEVNLVQGWLDQHRKAQP
jgi:hypothetical protein